MVGLFWLVKFITTPTDWPMPFILIGAMFIKSWQPYASNLFLADDQKVFAMLGGKNPDHTISGHVGYRSLQGRKEYQQAEKVIDLLFWWQPDHCRNAIEVDEIKGTR